LDLLDHRGITITGKDLMVHLATLVSKDILVLLAKKVMLGSQE